MTQAGHYKVVKVLLEDSRVNPCVDDNFALRWAVTNQYNKIIELLVRDSRMKEVVKHNQYLFSSPKSVIQEQFSDSRMRRTPELIGR